MPTTRTVTRTRDGRVPHNLRGLLLSVGVGDFNATGMIRFMLFSPHQTDPDMPSVILLTRHVQLMLNRMGANVPVSGMLDQPTDDFLRKLCGGGYLTRPWYQIIEALVSAKNRGTRLEGTPDEAALQAIGDVYEPPLGFLPDVPGGIITYGLGAAALWYLFKKKR